jgi:alkylhydroperoxidase family enzyme
MAYHGQLPDDLYNRLTEHFTQEEIIALYFQIGSKNGANWFIIAMGIENK